MNDKKVFAIVPCRNEAKHITNVVEQLNWVVDSVIVVDDFSTDDSDELAYRAGGEVILTEKNVGKSQAMLIGCNEAIKRGAEILVFFDGDGQHNAKDVPRMLQHLDKVDIVFSGRSASGMPPIKILGNMALTMLTNLVSGVWLRDSQCGLKAMSTSTFHKIKWNSKHYAMESDIQINTGRAKLNYTEIKIDTVYHDIRKGTRIHDGIGIFFHLIRRFTNG